MAIIRYQSQYITSGYSAITVRLVVVVKTVVCLGGLAKAEVVGGTVVVLVVDVSDTPMVVSGVSVVTSWFWHFFKLHNWPK